MQVVHLDAETARDEPSMQGKSRWRQLLLLMLSMLLLLMMMMAMATRWSMRMYSGAWQKGVTAGGCRNNSGKYDNDDQFDHCHDQYGD